MRDISGWICTSTCPAWRCCWRSSSRTRGPRWRRGRPPPGRTSRARWRPDPRTGSCSMQSHAVMQYHALQWTPTWSHTAWCFSRNISGSQSQGRIQAVYKNCFVDTEIVAIWMQLSTVNVSRYCEAQGQGKGKVRLGTPCRSPACTFSHVMCDANYVMCVRTISDMFRTT